MDTTTIDHDCPLALRPLTFLEEGDEVTVGCADRDSYAVLPADGAALLKQLVLGVPPARAAQWYEREYGESVDIDEFLVVLDEFEMLTGDDESTAVAPVRWQRLGATLLGPFALAGYAVLVIAAIVAMARDPALAPDYRNIFFSSSLAFVMVGMFVGQIPLMLLHEASHALAGRRLGLNSTLSIGLRFYVVVFETSLDGLVTVPRRRRYLPILAGMLTDVVLVAVPTLGAAALRAADGPGSFGARLALALAFSTVLRLSWQFYFFLRTDLYYLVTTVLGCHDLHAVAAAMLRRRLNRVLGRTGRPVDESTWHPRDRAVARWYAWLMLVGYVAMTVIFLTEVLPAIVVAFELVLHRLQGNPSVPALVDAVVFLAITLGELGLATVLAYRARRRRRTRSEVPQ